MHTKDLAKAYRLVLEQGKSDSAYNVCSEQGVTVGDIAMARSKKFNLIKPLRALSRKDVLSEEGDWALGPMLNQCMSAEKIINELGWHPDYTSIVNMAAE